ncbi:dTDP-4-dehydrorhamnose 3,5-epimerase [Falsirhodobacter algicola]|uniref:dTDP-4-dehydrorhamnose 3,5-epimerase n=1 Tax=Falsirhodobacter algicola TaxID=2692330 RepID=A0A8J8SLH5_9RHOB|nr:dTDP-4-dehydrorhamnose 3,5-epimerase [Falsirhodobacter algicola]QUS36419.1 dTDP-4-dehydrorhamnose 3,5-epimerase [Falsirhodobacter algicola]
MQIEDTALPGVRVLTPRRFGDARGFFAETWNRQTLRQAGLDLPDFVQDNHSFSARAGTLRGLHGQAPPAAQGKLVRCGRGALFDVALDVRRGSPTYGRWTGVELSFQNGRQIWIPPGFLHGFVTLEDDTEILYKCTAPYAPETEIAVHWDSAGIDWPLAPGTRPLLSERDALAPPLAGFDSPFDGGDA